MHPDQSPLASPAHQYPASTSQCITRRGNVGQRGIVPATSTLVHQRGCSLQNPCGTCLRCRCTKIRPNKKYSASKLTRSTIIQQAASAGLSSVRCVWTPAVSSTNLLVSRLVRVLEATESQNSWLATGLGLIGFDEAFDIVSAALCEGFEYRLRLSGGGTDHAAGLHRMFELYGTALRRMRTAPPIIGTKPTDAEIAVPASLAVIDSILADDVGSSDASMKAAYSHFQAAQRMLSQKNPETERFPSPITRGFFSEACKFRLFYASVSCHASLGDFFTTEYWYDMRPLTIDNSKPYWEVLQLAAQRMHVSASKAIEALKSSTLFNGTHDFDTCQWDELVQLCHVAIDLAEDVAESEALQEVRIQFESQDQDLPALCLIPLCFEFGAARWPILLHYWDSYLMVLRLYVALSLRLQYHLGEQCFLGPFRHETLRETYSRLVSNILMSCKQVMSQSIMSRCQMIHPLLMVWDAVGRLPNANVPGRTSSEVKSYIMSQFASCGLNVVNQWREHDIDNALVLFSRLSGSSPQP